jgi:hypothetical protein
MPTRIIEAHRTKTGLAPWDDAVVHRAATLFLSTLAEHWSTIQSFQAASKKNEVSVGFTVKFVRGKTGPSMTGKIRFARAITAAVEASVPDPRQSVLFPQTPHETNQATEAETTETTANP